MQIVYYCYGGTHSSIVSAAIHLGRLPADRVPTHQEILGLSDFDLSETWEIGTLFFKGHDEAGHSVYTLGLGGDQPIAKRALSSFLKEVGVDTSELLMFEALPHINRFAKVGGALSRRYGWVRLGRPLAALGVRRSYPMLLNFVHGVKEQVNRIH